VKKKVLIVDDSAFMRKLISDFLSTSDQLEVAGIARNGEDAIAKIMKLSPDVLTLDVEMPKMNGIEALKRIMSECPVPVVMLSSTTKEGAEETLKAIQLGAVDFIAKPSGTISLDLHKIQDEIVQKVLSASQVSITKLLKSTTSIDFDSNKECQKVDIPQKADHVTSRSSSLDFYDNHKKKIILIGTSTGGPRALQHVLTELPSSVKAPVLIVQHMPAGFTKSLADRLDSISGIRVKEAEQGEVLQDGTAYIAPGGYHMKIVQSETILKVHLTKEEEPRNGHRPSVDVLFESVSIIDDYNKIAVIMTGMGTDGTQGVKKIKEYGTVKTIAESPDSCIVYGMPKSVIAANLSDEVVNVDEIAQSIMKYMM
jgi:two-component system, chemotaxis family, protein-glutamate methylesterase/glutaminase